MDYLKIYQSLINKARNTQYIGYTEVHHIIPRCMGGTDDPMNLVTISPEEHYTAHLLLVKIYPNNHKVIHAAHMMTRGKYRNNKLYGWIKRKLSVIASERFKGKKLPPRSTEWANAISEAKKGKPQTPESNKKRSDTLKGRTSPNKGKKGKPPWNKGISFNKGKLVSIETKTKLSEINKNKLITCLGCKQTINIVTFNRYHRIKCQTSGIA